MRSCIFDERLSPLPSSRREKNRIQSNVCRVFVCDRNVVFTLVIFWTKVLPAYCFESVKYAPVLH